MPKKVYERVPDEDDIRDILDNTSDNYSEIERSEEENSESDLEPGLTQLGNDSSDTWESNNASKIFTESQAPSEAGITMVSSNSRRRRNDDIKKNDNICYLRSKTKKMLPRTRCYRMLI